MSGGVGRASLSPCHVPLSLLATAADSSVEILRTRVQGGVKGRWIEGLHRKRKKIGKFDSTLISLFEDCFLFVCF